MPVPTSFADISTTEADNSPSGAESPKGVVDNYLRQGFAFTKTLYNDKANKGANSDITSLSGLTTALSVAQGGTGGATAAAARASLGVVEMSKVKGLTGNVNSTTPLTKYDLSATAVVLQNANGDPILRQNTGTLTCDLGLAGSAANGRDQVAAFTANSWIYLYFIWNGTTLATLASLSATAPTLPIGYTHWAYATALRWNASSNIVPCYARGSEVVSRSEGEALTAGSATSYTAVALSSFIPPNATTVKVRGMIQNSNASTSSLRTSIDGVNDFEYVSASPGGSVTGFATNKFVFPNVGQQVYYRNTQTSGLSYLFVTSFTIPNGDA